jgi:hypothetical protein
MKRRLTNFGGTDTISYTKICIVVDPPTDSIHAILEKYGQIHNELRNLKNKQELNQNITFQLGNDVKKSIKNKQELKQKDKYQNLTKKEL